MIVKKTIGKLPTLIGAYDSSKVYGKKNRVTLYGSEFESLIDNNTYAPATLNNDSKVVTFDTEHWSIISNGTSAFLAGEKLDQVSFQDNSEFIKANTDSEGKLLEAIDKDGNKIIYNDLDVRGNFVNKKTEESISSIEDKTDLLQVEDSTEHIDTITDSEGKILSSRDNVGNLIEHVGFKSPKINTDLLELSQNGKEKFSQSLNAISDYSNDKFVELPIPNECSKVNIIINGRMPVAYDNSDAKEGYIEYSDKYGNYFKKKITGLSTQGDSSMNFPWKNYKFDLDDDSKIKFGNWVAQDSFHLKKYYSDNFRGQCIVAYWLAEQIYLSRELADRYPYSYMFTNDDIVNGKGSFKKDFPTGAMTHPDGFPIRLYVNDEYTGIWDWNLKKDKDNYAMSKDDTNMILLDGTLGIEFFGGSITWSDFELGNPKPKKMDNGWELTTVDGNKYDGDFPKEFIGETTVLDNEKGTIAYDPANDSHVKTAKVKANIVALSKAISDITSQSTDEGKKLKFKEYFKENEVIDYFLFGNVTYDFDGFRKNWLWCTWDGKKWSPVIYDKDNVFGVSIFGTPSYIENSITNLLGTGTNVPTGLCYSLFADDVKAEYKRLRDNGIFSEVNITGLLEKWIKKVGYDNLKEEIEEICVDSNGIPQTPSYRPANDSNGNAITYSMFPTTGGIYNSIQRVSNWLVKRIAHLDSVFEYNVN